VRHGVAPKGAKSDGAEAASDPYRDADPGYAGASPGLRVPPKRDMALTARKRPIIIGEEAAKEPCIVFSDVVLKIIEELSDGFLILNGRGEILFFNEVLLRLTGWRSKDILSGEGATFLSHLGMDKCRLMERLTPIPDLQGSPRYFRVASFSIEGES
jgi:PAS domain-containing protein